MPDILDFDLAAIFVGEAAGAESARRGEYYADPTNVFWKNIHEAGITDRPLVPSQARLLLSYGVGLTDVLKNVTNPVIKKDGVRHRRASPDDVEGLCEKISRYRPSAVCFFGRESARLYFNWSKKKPAWGRQDGLFIGQSRVWLCPSTSGLAGRHNGQRLSVLRALYNEVVKPWQDGHGRSNRSHEVIRLAAASWTARAGTSAKAVCV